jgi:hypothetical protein
MKKHSVKGLANIGTLVGRADLPVQPPVKRERRDVNAIFHRTREKIEAAIPLGANLDPKHKAMIETYLLAGLREANNVGHADALEQNSAVEKLLEKQYEARTKVTMPAVAAGIMEQRGLSSMTLDLALMATVFQRCKIEYVITDEDVIEYTLRPIAEGEQ